MQPMRDGDDAYTRMVKEALGENASFMSYLLLLFILLGMMIVKCIGNKNILPINYP